MKRRLFIGSGAAVVAAGGAYWLNGSDAAVGSSNASSGFGAAMAQSSENSAPIDTSGIVEMTMGDKDAPVTVVEYSSFTCPHCATFHENVLPDIKKNYIETGKIRYIMREAYFSKYDLWASLMARCGGEMRYFGIADILMKKQREWLADGKPDTVVENLRKIGLTAGLTNEDLDACFKDEDRVKALVAWYQENFTRDEMNSTPSFMIDGKKYSNMNYADFSESLDAKLAE
ncbi:MAG TPA: thiol-disulfide oxidoreductase [Rhodobacteraceae bacterium]|nr:thiol-disulfide oxidoreductase [Paracoccaceae bacterium]